PRAASFRAVADPRDDDAAAPLTARGARQAGADPLPAFAQLLEDAFDAEGPWNLAQLGAALLQADRGEIDGSVARANGGEEHATTLPSSNTSPTQGGLARHCGETS